MKFKSEAEYNMKSIRFLLLTITTMFIIIAGLMIVLGFSVYSHYHTLSFFYENARTGKILTPSILCILLGMFLLIVTLFGFFGSLKQSTCMVNLYAFILTVMLILKLIVVIISFTLDFDTLMNSIYIPVWQYASEPEIEAEIDVLQRSILYSFPFSRELRCVALKCYDVLCKLFENRMCKKRPNTTSDGVQIVDIMYMQLNCCGSYSFLDYDGMNFTSKHSTTIISTIIDGNQVTMVLPESCCITQGIQYCSTMRSNSCKSQVANLFLQNSTVIGVLGVSVMFVQLLGIIFALLLARCIRRVKSERGLMTWKIKEQMIIARQNEENQKEQSKDDGVYIPPHESSIA